MSGTIVFTSVGLNLWTVPADWNNSNNLLEAIGGGAGGVSEPSGGGGGAYVSSSNITLIPGSTIYIFVGAGGVTPPHVLFGVAGGNSWVNIVSNGPPINLSQGILAGGGFAGTNVIGGAGGIGYIGQIRSNGGAGTNSDRGAGGSGGGAGGPHGAGQNGYMSGLLFAEGGAGDAGFGGAGGLYTVLYSALNNGQPGPNMGSGGGGSHDGSASQDAYYAGKGGLYGGGGGSTTGGSVGAQGIVKITYYPFTAPANTPALPPPGVNTAPPSCVPNGFATATPAEVYWSYGSWNDLFNNVSSAHYDTNYKTLLSLSGDNDTISYDTQYNASLTPWNMINEEENFYIDYPRIWKSRSNEWIDDGGAKSVWMRHRTLIGDADCVPNIDAPSGYATLISNMLYMDEQTYGYRLTYSNNTGMFLPGDIVTQQLTSGVNISGTVYMMDPNYIYVNIPVGGFFSGFTVQNAYNPSINAYVTASVEMNEKYSANVFPGQSRYICKSTALLNGQDAEDLQVFMTAHRPANSNFKVYAKIINHSDTGKFHDKIWSRLSEVSTTMDSFSSLTNFSDLVNVHFEFPESQLLFGNLQSCACATNSLYVTVPTIDYFAAGDYIYLSSLGQQTFCVRQIYDMPNNTTLTVSTYPSFSNTSNLNIGIIRGLEDLTGAFLYDQNSNIVRYVTNNDVSYDMFNQFAVKIVPISDNPVVCPTVTEFRAVAVQSTI